MDALAELPDDPALLKQMLSQRAQELAQHTLTYTTTLKEREALIAQRDTVIAQREAQLEQVRREATERIEALQQKHQAEVAALLRRFYGPRNERFQGLDPTQLLLFGQRVDQLPVDEKSVAQEAGEKLTTRSPRNKHKHGRGKLPEHLPRIRIEHDLPAEQKPCPCCGQERHKLGEETSEQLEYIPASFKVLQHVRFKYACRPPGALRAARHQHADRHRGQAGAAPGADRKESGGSGPARVHHHQQAGRSSAAVPPGTHL